jgi:hypothetical protein
LGQSEEAVSDPRSLAFWEARLGGVTSANHPWRLDAEEISARAESRRARAKFNTGSINTTTAIALRSIASWSGAKRVIEVGTFIGNSTLALKLVASRVCTVDFSNDCFEPHIGVETFPHKTSLEMFEALAARGYSADLCFFDGRLGPKDTNVLAKITAPQCVYVFDDYSGREKGTCNVELLQPRLTDYALIFPCGRASDTTLAVLAPESML